MLDSLLYSFNLYHAQWLGHIKNNGKKHTCFGIQKHYVTTQLQVSWRVYSELNGCSLQWTFGTFVSCRLWGVILPFRHNKGGIVIDESGEMQLYGLGSCSTHAKTCYYVIAITIEVIDWFFDSNILEPTHSIFQNILHFLGRRQLSTAAYIFCLSFCLSVYKITIYFLYKAYLT